MMSFFRVGELLDGALVGLVSARASLILNGNDTGRPGFLFSDFSFYTSFPPPPPLLIATVGNVSQQFVSMVMSNLKYDSMVGV